jgi:hypothetical protein
MPPNMFISMSGTAKIVRSPSNAFMDVPPRWYRTDLNNSSVYIAPKSIAFSDGPTPAKTRIFATARFVFRQGALTPRIEYLDAACDLRGIKRRQADAYPPFPRSAGTGKSAASLRRLIGRNPIYSSSGFML